MNIMRNGVNSGAAQQGGRLAISRDPPRSSLRLHSRPVPPAERHFLFVGGPFGSFFRDLAGGLRDAGAAVTHVTTHGGDWLDWGWNDSVVFREPFAHWEEWVGDLILQRGITDVVTYGDCGKYSGPALTEASRLDVARHVFELGYFRPDWVTLERNGVNGYSSLPRDPRFYHSIDLKACHYDEQAVGLIMPYHVWYSIRHCLAHYAGVPFFPRFTHSWPESPMKQAVGYMSRVAFERVARARVRRAEQDVLESDAPFFLCTLQKPGDTQIRVHSRFKTLVPFIDHVTESFARWAPPEARLVFKAHPLDNGMEPREKAIEEAAETYGVQDRLVFLPSGSLANLTQKTRGVVTVNSTAGLAAVHKGRPTITLGDAFYDIPGITHQSGLKEFWTNPEPPDSELFNRFRAVVMTETQINGNYYSPKGKKMALPEAQRRLLDR
jgi:capsular polysaccharide export protein